MYYLPDPSWRELVDTLVRIAIEHDPVAPVCLRSQIIEALAEIGSIAPDYCREDGN